MYMRFLLVIITSLIILLPSIVQLPIPIRIEDIIIFSFMLLYSITMHFKYNIDRDFKKIIVIFILFVFINYLAYSFSVFEGYPASIKDINTILLYLKALTYMISGYILGSLILSKKNHSVELAFFAPIFVSSIIALVQYFEIGSLNKFINLLYNSDSNNYVRAVGTLGNPNYAAYFHGIALILIMSYNLTSLKNYLLKYAMLAIVFLSIIVTFSRTGILAALISIVLMLFFNRRYKSIIGVMIGALIIVNYYLSSLIEGTRFQRIAEGSSGGSISNFGNRTNLIWSHRLQQFLDNPIIGLGPRKEDISTTIFSNTLFDNTYLLLLVTSGATGLLIYLLFFYKVFTKDYLAVKHKNKQTKSYTGVLCTLIVYNLIYFLTVDLVWSDKYNSFFYLLIGFYLYKSHLDSKLFKLKPKKTALLMSS